MTNRHIPGIFLLLAAAGLGVESSLAGSASAGASDAAVVVCMEGETHELRDIDWTDSNVTFEEGEIRFYFAEDGNPVTLNLNLSNTGILEVGSAVYVLPEANAAGMQIDLNFFNRNRASSRTQRRIVFDEGTIEIQSLTRNSLRMTFKGVGHPLMNPERLPIEGSVKVTF